MHKYAHMHKYIRIVIYTTFFKMKEYVGIYIKTEKAQEQDGFGNKMKYHFHITTLHKYTQLE